MMKPRPYQETFISSVDQGWSNFQRQLGVLATGTGKTVCFAIIAAIEAARGGRTLILAHRDELLQQAQDKLRAAVGLSSLLEKADSRAYSYMDAGLFSEQVPRVVVGSIQTLQGPRLAQWPKDTFTLVVCDEAHHCLSDSYRRVLEHFKSARILGVTATPDRGDKRSLGEFYQTIAYEYPLKQAIKEGFLSPITARLIPLNIDLTAVHTVAGDYNVNELDDAIMPYIGGLTDVMAENLENRPTLAFLPLVRTSEVFADELNKKGVRARHIDGQSKDRAVILRAFERGEFQVLCNSALLLEGYDCPDIACIVNLRPTQSRSLYSQIVGRGTRIAPGKTDLLLLDFLWQSTKHSLCVPASLFAKSPEEAKEIMDVITAGGGQMDLLDAEEDAKASREESLRRSLENQRGKRGRQINPLEFALSIDAEDLIEYEGTMGWHFLDATPKQIETIGNYGFDTKLVTCRGHASALLERIFARKNAGLCTPKQASLLARYGYEDSTKISIDEAKTLIDEIAKRGWTVIKGPAGTGRKAGNTHGVSTFVPEEAPAYRASQRRAS